MSSAAGWGALIVSIIGAGLCVYQHVQQIKGGDARATELSFQRAVVGSDPLWNDEDGTAPDIAVRVTTDIGYGMQEVLALAEPDNAAPADFFPANGHVNATHRLWVSDETMVTIELLENTSGDALTADALVPMYSWTGPGSALRDMVAIPFEGPLGPNDEPPILEMEVLAVQDR